MKSQDISGKISIGGSKSISNRLLIIRSIADSNIDIDNIRENIINSVRTSFNTFLTKENEDDKTININSINRIQYFWSDWI